MRFKIKQRFPNCFTGHDPIEAEFDSVNELLNIPFIKSWLESKGFVRFSKSRMQSTQQILICEFEDYFCAMGWLYNSKDLDLPIWIDPSSNKKI